MATTVSAHFCSICGKPLGGSGNCVVCLLSAGLDQVANEFEPHALVFEGFEIERRDDGSLWELGRGAMGVTYRALDKTLHRSVALKVIDAPAETGGSRTVQDRFLREARAAASLRHPNVAGVFHYGALADRCYYAMELVEGETLEARVRRDGPLPVEVALEVAMQVTQALSAAAEQGLVHRDLKPGNIMLTRDEASQTTIHAKVIDFGLAKVTADALGQMDLTHGGFVGTPTFASPEQFEGGDVDPRSDIYSLGATLWYALTGLAPRSGSTIEKIRHSQKHEPLPVDQLRTRKVPQPVIALLRRTLAANPAQRPASARELLMQLRSVRGQLARGRVMTWALPIAAAIVGLAAFFAVHFAGQKPTAPPGAVTEKSIAVLPLENLSPEKENAFFAEALQDDLLTSLAKVRELKVISRTSVSQYRGPAAARNLRTIARDLGVQNILEGTVRREGNRLLVNMQLIDAGDDRHLWAEHYDRALAESIGLQAEVAAHVAAILKAKLAPEEKARLEAKPTNNVEAYVLYLKALELEERVNATAEDREVADKLYQQAIAHDPSFALAYARASILNNHLAAPHGDVDLRAKARRQADEALRLAPGLAEAHLALALCLYWGEKDYSAALKEFSIAESAAPNNVEILHLIAGIYRRQGRWRESIANYQRAMELDPRNHFIVSWAAAEYLLVRDWPAATATYNRALEIAPDSAIDRIGLAYLEVFRNSNPASGRDVLGKIPADPDGKVSEAKWDLAMLARDFDAAEKILHDFPSDSFPNPEEMPKSFFHGRIARARGDVRAAERLLEAAAPDIENFTREHPEAQNHANLGLLYAYLGRKKDAIGEARRALEMEPESQNAFHGASRAGTLAVVYALTGETDQAITLIERLLSTPGCVSFPNFPQNVTLADLRLRWEWDLLRQEPRFQKIVGSPEPKTIYQ
jgi:TolB-like protein/Tfp pilus assembly protein PilF